MIHCVRLDLTTFGQDRPCKSLRTLRLPKYYNPFQDLDDEELDRWTNVANEIEIICS